MWRHFSDLVFVGEYRSGRPAGLCWRPLIGDTLLYGDPFQQDVSGEFTWDNIIGMFNNGEMVADREARVEGSRCRGGIMRR